MAGFVVECRLARVARLPWWKTAPALKWVVRNAKTYTFDMAKSVVTGHAAGSHSALAG